MKKKETTKAALKRYKRIVALSANKPHPCWGGWRKFLEKVCTVVDQYRGVTFFNTTNCNYVVFPDGTLIQNYGYNGQALMNRIRAGGVKTVQKEVEDNYNEIKNLMAKFGQQKGDNKNG